MRIIWSYLFLLPPMWESSSDFSWSMKSPLALHCFALDGGSHLHRQNAHSVKALCWESGILQKVLFRNNINLKMISQLNSTHLLILFNSDREGRRSVRDIAVTTAKDAQWWGGLAHVNNYKQKVHVSSDTIIRQTKNTLHAFLHLQPISQIQAHTVSIRKNDCTGMVWSNRFRREVG